MTLGWPLALLVLAPLALAALLLERTRPEGRGARLTVRLTLLATIALALAGPSVAWEERPTPRWVLAVDRSAAAGAEARADAAELAAAFLERARSERAAPQAVGFAARAGAVFDPAADAARGWPAIEPSPDAGRREPAPAPEGRAAVGLAAARTCFGAGQGGRVLLVLAPGADLEGAADAARDLAAAGIALETAVVPRTRERPAAPRVAAFQAPTESTGPFEVRAEVDGPAGLAARLWVDGRPAWVGPVPDVAPRRALVPGLDLAPGRHLLALEVQPAAVFGAPGATALAAPSPADGPPLALAEVEVRETPRLVLCVEDPERSALRRAALAQGLLVEAVAPQDLGARLAEGTAAFHVLVLDAVAAHALDAPTQGRVAARVAGGLGLFVEAGDDPERWAGLATSPLGELLPVEPLAEPPPPPPPPKPAPPQPPPPPTELPEPTPGPGRKAERRPEEALPISLLLVLDRSASMRGERWSMATEAALKAAGVLSSFDRVGVVTFAEDASLDLPMGGAGSPSDVALRLPPEAEGRGTNLVAALRKAAEVMARETFPIRHVLLLTDGQHNPTGMRSESAIWADVVKPLNAAGATLTVVGLSTEHDERTLKELAQWSRRGLYVPVYEARQVPTVVVVDARRVTEARSADVRARLPDPQAAPRPPAPPEPPRPPPPAPPGPPEPPAPTPTGPDVQPLTLGAPHPALRGFEDEKLPGAEAPRRSGPRLGASVLLARGDQAVLAARRHGLGRVLAWLARRQDRGLAPWALLGRLYGQALRSLVPPLSAFEGTPPLALVPGPRGDALAWPGVPREVAATGRLGWRGAGEVEDLGPASRMLEDEPLPLPPLARGTVGHVEARDGAGAVVRRLTYVAGTARAVPSARETAARLDALALGASLRRVPPPVRALPLHLGLIVLALLLLPLDTWLHRRRRA